MKSKLKQRVPTAQFQSSQATGVALVHSRVSERQETTLLRLNRASLAAALLSAGLTIQCDNSTVVDDSAGATVSDDETGTETNSTSTVPACTGALDRVRATWDWQFKCPDRYGEVSAVLLNCDTVYVAYAQRYLGSCGGVNAMVISWGTHSQSCYYDVQSDALVGARANNDVPFPACESQSNVIHAGTVPNDCPWSALMKLEDCPPQDPPSSNSH